MRRRVLLGERSEDIIDCRITNVNQRARVGEALHRSNLIALLNARERADGFAAIVFLKNFLVCDWCDAVIIVLKPSRIAVRLDECEVLSAMEISRVDKDTM